MRPELPPPDPFESTPTGPSETFALPAPTAMFLAGPPSPEAERVSDAILDRRPGVLIVAVR